MDPKVKALLDTIAFAEGTSTHPLTKNDGYDVIVTGVDGPEIFENYLDHPFAAGRSAKLIRDGNSPLKSTASGRYQLLLKWWRAYKAMLDLKDFMPSNQDAVAVRQMKEQGILEALDQNDLSGAIHGCSKIWASFPGTYSQGNGPHSEEVLITKYNEFLGG